MKVLILAMVLTLIGCASTKPIVIDPTPVEPTHTDVTNTIPKEFFVPCQALPESIPASASSAPASASSSNSGVLMKMYSDLQVQYSNCAIKDDCLIAAVEGTQCKQPKTALRKKPL